MKTLSLTTLVAVVAVLSVHAAAIAQQSTTVSPHLRSVRPAVDAAFGEYNDQQPKDEAPSLSDQKPAVPAGCAADVTCGSNDCCNGCNDCCNNCCDLNCPDPEIHRLLGDVCALKCRDIDVYGWISAGASLNNHGSEFNGPVTFNDREGGQMNQLYAIMERTADTEGCGWAIGGRVDLLYGSDHRFTMARGLETRQDFSNKWNGDGQEYGIALPQAYLEVAYNDISVKMGHFYTIIGYEVVPAPDNFFYSHAYTMQYGEPFTHTGLLASWSLNDNWSVSGGFHRGWDNWEDHPGNDQLDFLGGVSWTNDDEDTSLAFAITTGEEDSAVGFAPRTMYSIVFSREYCRWQYVLQHDHGIQEQGFSATEDAEWYGINQYLIYKINCCWEAGVRFEWFRDDDGARVAGVDQNNPNVGPFEGDFYEITWGLNYKPNDNIVVRPELRYDWFDGAANPFDNGNDDDQFMAAVDVIFHW